MALREDDLTIVWIGRFLRSGGYGAATRGIYRALRESSIHTFGIDIDTLQPIDDSAFPHFTVTTDKAALRLRATQPSRRVIVIVHELPPLWNTVQVSGRARLAGYTVTETEQIPFGWTVPMLGVDEIFVATDFNKKILASAGLPASMISVLPHAVDTKLFAPRSEVIPLRAANSFRFLSLVSNLNRKDVGRIIRGYCDAFAPGEDVSLVIKLPDSLRKDDFSKYLLEATYPWVDLNSANLPHILLFADNMPDEKLVELYASCHVYVSLERGKGWDLPSLEAMLVGLPAIGVDWGGNTQFQNRHNARLIEPLGPTTFAGDDLVMNRRLYTGHTWSSYDIADVSKEMRRMYENYTFERARVSNARQELERVCSPVSVVEAIRARVRELEIFNFRSNEPASVTLSSQTDEQASPTVRRVAYEALDVESRSVLDRKFKPGGHVEEWIGRRRQIWGRRGPVLPPQPEHDRIRQLHNRYLDESIFIVGNGPSLNRVKMERLGNYYTFAANRIYLMFDRTSWRPDFYTALDWRVTPDNYAEINRLRDMLFFFPHRFRGLLREGPDVFWYESLSPGRNVFERFEQDVTNGVRGGGTVLVAALQIAWYLGFRRYFLIGVDASYSIPPSVIQSGGDQFGTGIQINLESRANDDRNHFDPRYFGAGAKWHDPNVDEMKRGFEAARRAIEFLGGEICNATEGGNLGCIDPVSFDDALRSARPKAEQQLQDTA